MNIKKILIGLSLGLASIISQAAPTDCRQLVEDGEVNCIKATSWFKYASSNAPLTRTFEETVSVYSHKYCESRNSTMTCYVQYQNQPAEPPEGRTPNGIHENDIPYTYINYETKESSAGWIVMTSYPNDTKKFPYIYGKYQMPVYHLRTCPENTINIDVGPDTYLRYCKPNPIPKNTPTSCDTGCNASSGNVSVSN